LNNYKKLTNPFAKSKNAEIQRNVVEIVKTKDKRRSIEENISIKPRMSPVGKPITPLSNKSPAKNKVTLSQGSIPKIMLMNTTAEKQSIAPRILTNTIEKLSLSVFNKVLVI
jgi:hypothetical protein